MHKKGERHTGHGKTIYSRAMEYAKMREEGHRRKTVVPKTGLEMFEKLWWMAPTPTVWCERLRHPMHRLCPVILNYEDLPPPFHDIATQEPHEGKSGETHQITPTGCFSCPRNVQRGGICDPV
jgi:hypothetical protein